MISMNPFLYRSSKTVTNKACITKEEPLIPIPSETLRRHEDKEESKTTAIAC